MDDENIEESWIILSSKNFNTIHIVKLGDCVDPGGQTKRNILGGVFYESAEDLQLRVPANDVPNFWSEIDIIF